MLNVKLFKCQKKYISNAKYTIQHRIEPSQTIKCIQYNIHDTMSCELPTSVKKNLYFFLYLYCLGFGWIKLEKT